MRTIFLADAHLREPGDYNYRILLQFLDDLTGNTDTLYLMGDLFDFWIGFPGQPFRNYDPVLQALQKLVDHGCRLVCFEGNHDFHLGPVFRQSLQAVVYTGPARLTIQGKRIYLCHGDQINLHDYAYRRLRFLLHNPIARAAVRVFPPALAERIREKLQRRSRAAYRINSTRWNYPEIIRQHARRLAHTGFDAMITGHFHIPLCEKLPGSDFTILALGDWMEDFSYGEIKDGVLTISRYQPLSPVNPE